MAVSSATLLLYYCATGVGVGALLHILLILEIQVAVQLTEVRLHKRQYTCVIIAPLRECTLH